VKIFITEKLVAIKMLEDEKYFTRKFGRRKN
jgi:hypothetical protein